MVDICRTRRPC